MIDVETKLKFLQGFLCLLSLTQTFYSDTNEGEREKERKWRL